MKDRSKQIFRIILGVAIGVGGMYVASSLYHPDGGYHQNSILGAFVGLILIGFYQQSLKYDWVYSSRLLLNAVALGVGFLIWNIPDLIFFSTSQHWAALLLIDMAMGFVFGLFIGLFQLIRNLNLRKKTPFSGIGEPLISSSVQVLYSDGTKSLGGRVILIRDKLVILSPLKMGQTILLNDIKEISVGRTLGFPNKLILILEGAESMALTLSMPGYWKNKIQALSIQTEFPKHAN